METETREEKIKKKNENEQKPKKNRTGRPNDSGPPIIDIIRSDRNKKIQKHSGERKRLYEPMLRTRRNKPRTDP